MQNQGQQNLKQANSLTLNNGVKTSFNQSDGVAMAPLSTAGTAREIFVGAPTLAYKVSKNGGAYS
jgi:hypothetical protein